MHAFPKHETIAETLRIRVVAPGISSHSLSLPLIPALQAERTRRPAIHVR